MQIERITHNPAVMGGKPCIRGLRVTVGTFWRCWPAASSANGFCKHTLTSRPKTLMRYWPTRPGGSKSGKSRWSSHECAVGY